MGDRLANGFFAGIVAFVITTPLNLALVHLNLIDQGFPDFAGAMSLGRFPETLSELIFGTIVEGMTSGAWGIIFAFFIRVIGNKYLLFKGMDLRWSRLVSIRSRSFLLDNGLLSCSADGRAKWHNGRPLGHYHGESI